MFRNLIKKSIIECSIEKKVKNNFFSVATLLFFPFHPYISKSINKFEK